MDIFTMGLNRVNACPNCNKVLTEAYSKHEDPIPDGFICPFCGATLGYKRIYPWIGFMSLLLFGVSAVINFGCLFFKNECLSFSGYIDKSSTIFLFIFVVMLFKKNAYVLKAPN